MPPNNGADAVKEWATLRALKSAAEMIVIVAIGFFIARHTGLEQWAYEQGRNHRKWFESLR